MSQGSQESKKKEQGNKQTIKPIQQANKWTIQGNKQAKILLFKTHVPGHLFSARGVKYQIAMGMAGENQNQKI